MYLVNVFRLVTIVTLFLGLAMTLDKRRVGELSVFEPGEVEFAISERNGTLSVLKRRQHRPAISADPGVDADYIGLPVPLIVEGKVCE